MLTDAGEDAIAQVESLESLAAADAENAKPEEKTEGPKPENPKPEDKRPTGYDRVKAKLAAKEAELAAKEAEIAALKAAKDGVRDAPKGKPDLKDYDEKTWDQYIADVAEWTAEQKLETKLKEREAKSKEEALRSETTKRQNEYKAKAEEFAKSAPDFHEVVESYDGPWNQTIAQALLDSDVGPEIAYYLAKNPDEAEKLDGMNYGQVSRFMGRIEAKLESPKSEVKTTKAPPPLSVPRGNGPKNTLDPYGNPDMTAEEWRAYKAKLRK